MDVNTTQRIKDSIAYEAARTAPPAGFPRLPDIPAARYTNTEFLELEEQGLWKRSWLYAGHSRQVAEPGSWFLTRNAGAPILIPAAILGFMAYGTFEFTNYAILKGWNLRMVITDVTWGTVLTAVSAWGGLAITKALFKV